MSITTTSIQNFSGGELSEKMLGRHRLGIYANGLQRCKNFIPETEGPSTFRTGLIHVNHTRLNQIADLQKFEFNDEQAYQLEFTNKKMRFYRDNGFILEDTVFTITGITQANPAVVTTSAPHGYTTGDEIPIDSVAGMTEVNGKSFLITVTGGSTYSLQDIDGNNIDSTAFTAYSSGGNSSKIFEIDTPYTEALDFFKIEKTQNADIMYLTHDFYEPRKLTRTGNAAWTLSRFTRTADPFLIKKVIGGVTQANPAEVTTTGAHNKVTGDIMIIEEIVGMTELNSQPYIITVTAGDKFTLADLDGNNIDSTAFTAYGSVGFASDQKLLPAACAFYESRLFYAGTGNRPDGIFASQSPEGSADSNPGEPRYDDFTLGTADDNGVQFSIANAEVNKIFWLEGTDKVLIAGTFGTEIEITGSTIDAPITPTSIKARAINRIGVEQVSPVNKDNSILYVQRGGLTLKSLQFDALERASYTPRDKNLVSDHITESGIKKLSWQTGRPDIIWAVRNDGILLSQTVNLKEEIEAWARHDTGALGEDKWLTVSTMPRPSSFDQMWAVVERVIDGNTRRYVGFLADEVIMPKRHDFITGDANKDVDDANFLRAMQEAQKEYIHLDSSLTYDGLNTVTTMTPAAVTGNPITFTAGAATFVASDVGREIWKKATAKGAGFGRAKILTFTNTTTVECQILQDFDSTDAMLASGWYLTANSISNLEHLEGREIAITTDGAPHPVQTVTNGAVTLDFQSSKFHIGLAYEGFMKTMPIEMPSESGTGMTRDKHINFVGLRVLETLGIEFGTNEYKPELIRFAEMPLDIGASQPLFTGIPKNRVPFQDGWENDKFVYIRQRNSLPAVVQMMVFYGETSED